MRDDAFDMLRRMTRARVALGRSGDGLPTQAKLEFQMAHALARDAVWGKVNFDGIAEALAPREVIKVASAAPDRASYLRRPDLGRRLAACEASTLPSGPFDLVFIIADGLSADAVENHAADVVIATEARLAGLTIGPVVLASQARVALGDDVGTAMRACLVAVLVGERPGLSAADSLGVYLTLHPAPGLRDSARNCISNIHGHGLSADRAADKLAWLVREALRIGVTGIGLKEAAPNAAIETTTPTPQIIHHNTTGAHRHE
ncbi:ethanolamine ammonia-lyase light chain [Bradyrhizobium sp. SSBR45G]|uniref:ethanolamine ammonia-lyase subunit EutC n=1 Tax=unclassified Bradyrhizobium TaxID=2631580 RepID=UPI002342B4BD|nr:MULTISPECIES: ethanolamine ammonia-lyase subunit EutC [unclassified Bradyrhizobium]GLH80504.1 ethanolamine ammonia-lyase light chain [Bradyrhizobium sp. SSBR45G]GLH87899.1 ethanolamine ammonia-lyase light chain [Bradyrhizobium sp. SSBR45R]